SMTHRETEPVCIGDSKSFHRCIQLVRWSCCSTFLDNFHILNSVQHVTCARQSSNAIIGLELQRLKHFFFLITHFNTSSKKLVMKHELHLDSDGKEMLFMLFKHVWSMYL